MGKRELGEELKAITSEEMIEAVKATSWKLTTRAGEEPGLGQEFDALREEYPGLATAVDLMIEADVVHGKSRDEAQRYALSGAWAFLALKSLVDQDQIQQIVGE